MNNEDRLVSASPRLSSALAAVVKRDLTLAFRHRGDLFNPILFFLLVSTLIPLGVSAEKEVLAMLAPGITWVMALLATLLSMDNLFRSDFDDGTLEQLVISPHPMYLLMLAKVFTYWLVTGLPLAIVSPFLALSFSLPSGAFWALFLSLLVGGMALSFIGAIGAALTVSLRKGGMLISLIIIPLYAPVLIFGTKAVTNAVVELPYYPHIAILGAILAMALGLAPLAIASAIKISVNN